MRLIVFALLNTVLLASCATLPQIANRSDSYAYIDTDATAIGVQLATRKSDNPGESGFYLLENGLDAFVARAVLAGRAERSIDAQYYLLHNDLVGRLFVGQLVKAAERGVRVRLLVDDMALADDDTGALTLNTHPNIEVRIFNPFSRNVSRTSQFLTRFGSVTRRMHNKSFTVDNQMSIIGGRNIGNEYFEADPDLAFGDLDVLSIGPVVERVSESFDLYWNHQLAYPVSAFKGAAEAPTDLETLRQGVNQFFELQKDSAYFNALQNSGLADKMRNRSVSFYWGTATVLYDHPDKINAKRDQSDLQLITQLQRYGQQISKELVIFSPYFVPGKAGVAWFEELINKGVRVRVLTNSLASTDVGAVHAGYAKYRKPMLRAGVELYELSSALTRQQRKEKKSGSRSSKASLHAKSFVLDREQVFIGSMNLDPRSIVENTEIGVVIDSAEIASTMTGWFDRSVDNLAYRLALKKNKNGTDSIVWNTVENGKPRVYTSEPNVGFWRRFGVGFLKLLPIESQL